MSSPDRRGTTFRGGLRPGGTRRPAGGRRPVATRCSQKGSGAVLAEVRGTRSCSRRRPGGRTMLANILSRYWWMTLLRGVIWVLFGLVAFVRPGISLVTLTLLFGAFA